MSNCLEGCPCTGAGFASTLLGRVGRNDALEGVWMQKSQFELRGFSFDIGRVSLRLPCKPWVSGSRVQLHPLCSESRKQRVILVSWGSWQELAYVLTASGVF